MIVVGGHTRSIGKTALVADIIRAFPEAVWTAVKITQFGHEVCSKHGHECGCTTSHLFAIDEESDRSNRSDTSRFLVAGAQRALWMRVQKGHLAEGLPELQSRLQGSEHVIVESNSILQYLRPELYLAVIDPTLPDFKESARVFLDRTNAIVLRKPLEDALAADPPVSANLLRDKPSFFQRLGEPLPEELVAWIRENYWKRSSRGESWNHFSC